ncbi:radical SAM protein [Azospirillum sp. B506]|uniref:radical SAM protein n=1 Tax=Azospirillum sp. B506 TaxID=137721 RepID=UPI0005B2B548|nr:radical SAM protein [Azospirillum sp. B506]
MSDQFNMDGHKLHWHLDRVVQWQKGERIAPLHIDMGISKGCNMACTYCYGVIQGRTGYGTNLKGVFNMPKEAILRTFQNAKDIGVRSIALIGEGENTLNPALYDAVDYARSIGLDLSLATNGLRIDRSRIDTLLRGLTWLRINISAATPESFRLIHQIDGLDRVIANTRALVEARKAGGYDCTIGLQMVMTKQNFDQVVPLAKLGAELGVDYFVIKPCSDTSDKLLDSPTDEYVEQRSIFEEAKTYSNKSYTVIPKFAKLMNGGMKDYPVCFGTKFLMAISADGSVFPCGHWFDVRRDEFLMGNVIETPFADIVSSERYWEVQEKIETIDVNKDCESNCRQHYINQYLSHLNNPPRHINFI